MLSNIISFNPHNIPRKTSLDLLYILANRLIEANYLSRSVSRRSQNLIPSQRYPFCLSHHYILTWRVAWCGTWQRTSLVHVPEPVGLHSLWSSNLRMLKVRSQKLDLLGDLYSVLHWLGSRLQLEATFSMSTISFKSLHNSVSHVSLVGVYIWIFTYVIDMLVFGFSWDPEPGLCCFVFVLLSSVPETMRVLLLIIMVILPPGALSGMDVKGSSNACTLNYRG